ncbi:MULTISPECIES: hypothetical protein [Bacillus]|uniref:Uncharacterized protein n=1 Tax=Bacillus cereus TaxID=1396 RepID=A0A2A8IS63_BACCE|nr:MULTISPECIES: hypothetical protein [Bacillus]MDH4424788.1 hypothetical protein [Bacillus cereus]PER22146.1 hypothetical protein CN476_21670 [Bacillus cereus]PFA58305.1 hypothetical protein CN402_20435 [Bacillus sp. AFS015896]PGL81177.1 hypothetical protein CN931_17595 [Bacillus sp. AFS054943]PGU01500.1 hypothetical protein COD19_13155 [Bacillus cereus]
MKKKINTLGIKITQEGKLEQTKPLFGKIINLITYNNVLLAVVKEAVQTLQKSENIRFKLPNLELPTC